MNHAMYFSIILMIICFSLIFNKEAILSILKIFSVQKVEEKQIKKKYISINGSNTSLERFMEKKESDYAEIKYYIFGKTVTLRNYGERND